jgi:hypothetical protein
MLNQNQKQRLAAQAIKQDTEMDLLGYLILKRAAKRYDELLPHNEDL